MPPDRPRRPRRRTPAPKRRTLAEIIRDGVREALRVNGWNITATARQLGIARTRVRRIMKRHRIRPRGVMDRG